MWECRQCGEMVRGSRERVSARCPRCREPLFERPGGPRLVEQEYPERGICAMHPKNVAIGTCRRCGNFICPVCRTRWQDRVLCLPCVQRFLAGGDDNPEERRGHARQAVLGCMGGLGAWALLVVAMVITIPAAQPGSGLDPAATQTLLVVAGLLVLASFVCALLGLGQSVTAIRTRGHRMIAATSGLILSGSFLGAVVGLMVMGIGRQ